MRTALFLLASSCLAAQLEIRVVDETGAPIWTRLEVHAADGTMLRPEGAIHSSRQNAAKWNYPYLGSFVVKSECRLEAPPGRYRVVAEHGTEYERVERQADLQSNATVRIQLKPWIHMRARGWWSGDMHVHRPVEDAEALVQAEDLNLGIVFTMWNRQNLWAGKALPADPVMRVDANHVLTIMNAEDERGGGAWMLHHLREPLGLETVVPSEKKTTESWSPPGIRFVRKARQNRRSPLFPWFDSEKPIWWEAPVMMALERPDSLGLLHNHFHQYGMMASEAWGRPRDQAKFPDLGGFADYSMHLIYRYWNLGMRVPPSAGSASGVLPNPVGYNRIYVKLDGPFDLDKWYEGVRADRHFVTNGPMLFWNPSVAGGRLRGTVDAEAREPIDRCEVVANGEILWKQAASGRKLRAKFDVDAAKHSWAAARCYLKTSGTVRMAHTAPVPLPGQWSASADARYFVEWIDELAARPDTRGVPELQELYRQARAFYAAKQ